ncbi:MAG: mechanosensitive ion channel family protein [Flavobacteriales bacterium]
MNWFTFLKAALFGIIAALLFYTHRQFTDFFLHWQLPEKFIPTLHRVFVAVCIIECTRLATIATYRFTNDGTRRDNFIIGLSHLSKVLYGVLAVVLALSIFNITVKEAITSLSLIAAAIVLMTKDYISNLINGMYLTFAKVITIGDQVQIENHKGKILDITLTNVHLLNDDDDIIYIPNNKVFSSEIINYTRRELKKSNIEFEVDNQLLRDADELQQEIMTSLGALGDLIQPGTHNLKVQGMKWEYTHFKFQYVLCDPLNKELDKKVRRHVIRFIVKWTAERRRKI